jgi:heme/copper-type cytochrome/quinol oxidase subunit 4
MDVTKAPDIHPSEPAAQYTDTLGKYIAVYICILILAGVQFVLAYQHVDVTAMFARMFFVALVEAGLALMFFMHLWAEKRGFMVSILVFTLFVLAAMQYGWTDAFRTMVGHAPYSSTTGQ